MSIMSNQKKLFITISDPQALQSSHWDKVNSNEFTLELLSGNIKSIQVHYNSVLVVQFETGEIRLDIGMNDLKSVKFVE
ncbi:MAG: hypothetical protein ACXAC8_16775 [Candidatus Hodarchaeales archaeon]|jgi:hypothetical protein